MTGESTSLNENTEDTIRCSSERRTVGVNGGVGMLGCSCGQEVDRCVKKQIEYVINDLSMLEGKREVKGKGLVVIVLLLML